MVFINKNLDEIDAMIKGCVANSLIETQAPCNGKSLGAFLVRGMIVDCLN